MTLYIIGNGFDLKHSLKTSYNDFHEYLQNKIEINLLKYLDRYFSFKTNWSDFEEQLGKPDISGIIHEESDLISNDDEEGTDIHTFGAKIYEICDLLTTKLKKEINNWILSVNESIPYCKKDTKFGITENDFYFTFNYTDTLEKLYGISNCNIWHIHGKAKYILCKPGDIHDDSDIIIGHKFEGKPIIPKAPSNSSVLSYFEGITEIEDYFYKSYKHTDVIIKDNICYFDKEFLSQFNCIYIIGHSLSDVDSQYFNEIIKNIGTETKINITYHGQKEKFVTIERSKKLEIQNANFIDI